MGATMMANFAIVGVNVALLTGLLVLYIRMLRQAPSRFTWGLTLFAGALWLQNAIQFYFFITMMKLYAGDMEWLVLIPNIAATLGAGMLLWVTIDPIGRRAAAEV